MCIRDSNISLHRNGCYHIAVLLYKFADAFPLISDHKSHRTGKVHFVKEHCDMVASIPMKGDIDSLNASVAAGVLAYEIVRCV